MQGPSVADAINAFHAADREVHKPLRMPIVEVFKGSRGGMCISGKVEAGAMKVTALRIRPDDPLEYCPLEYCKGVAKPLSKL